jgi:drug/metabolite transporter (DMT)-like permease
MVVQMTIMYSNPVLCALLAWAVRGERLGLLACSGIGATLVGVVLVSEPPFIFGGQQWSHTRSVGARTCGSCIACLLDAGTLHA